VRVRLGQEVQTLPWSARQGLASYLAGVGLPWSARQGLAMLVYTSANGVGHGPYNASPYGGANFRFSTGSSSRTTVTVTLTNSNNTATLCSSNYFV